MYAHLLDQLLAWHLHPLAENPLPVYLVPRSVGVVQEAQIQRLRLCTYWVGSEGVLEIEKCLLKSDTLTPFTRSVRQKGRSESSLTGVKLKGAAEGAGACAAVCASLLLSTKLASSTITSVVVCFCPSFSHV